MQQIDIDFEVFKALTARRKAEEHTYNDVLRELLNLDPASVETKSQTSETRPGRRVGGRFLADGTKLRADYKQRRFEAEIASGELIYDGKAFQSASAAAKEITGTNVNGLAFWSVKRPSDFAWQKLLALPKEKQ